MVHVEKINSSFHIIQPLTKQDFQNFINRIQVLKIGKLLNFEYFLNKDNVTRIIVKPTKCSVEDSNFLNVQLYDIVQFLKQYVTIEELVICLTDDTILKVDKNGNVISTWHEKTSIMF